MLYKHNIRHIYYKLLGSKKSSVFLYLRNISFYFFFLFLFFCEIFLLFLYFAFLFFVRIKLYLIYYYTKVSKEMKKCEEKVAEDDGASAYHLLWL